MPIHIVMNSCRFFIFKCLVALLIMGDACLSFADYLETYERAPKRSKLFGFVETKFLYSQLSFGSKGSRITQNHSTCLNLQSLQCFLLMRNRLVFSYSAFRSFRIVPFVTSISDVLRAKVTVGRFIEGGLWLYFPFNIKKLIIMPQLKISFPFYSVYSSDRLSVHQVMQFQQSLYIHFPIQRRFFPFLNIAYEYRKFNSWKSLCIGQVGVKYRDHKWEVGVLAGASIDCLSEISSYPNSFYQNGEIRYYSTHPFVIGGALWFDVRVSHSSSLYTRFESDIIGRDYSLGQSVSFGYKHRFLKKSKQSRYRKSSQFFRGRKQSIESILEDSNDQELLQSIEELQSPQGN